MPTTALSLAEAHELVTRALANAGANESNAQSAARALVAAEADGQESHGLSRVASYAAQLVSGKTQGRATPSIERVASGVIRVNAGFGFAYPAIDMVVDRLPAIVKECGIAAAAVHSSHHFGQAGAHVERLADRGLVALLFGNSPKAMAFWGGSNARTGTNPIAFAAPLREQPSLVVDLALSVAARGKIVNARNEGREIPEGWANNVHGRPTQDPQAALEGTLLAIGGPKGGALALMVEVLAAALTGGAFGWQANSVLNAKGAPPDLGQLFIAMEPSVLSGGTFRDRIQELLNAIAEEPGVRLPGQRRLNNRARARELGLKIPEPLLRKLIDLGTC